MKKLFAFFSDHTPFLKWWLLFTGLCVGTYFAFTTGLIQKFLEVDTTHISLLIFSIFILFTFITGYDTYRINKNGCTKGILNRTNALMTLGMLGTVAGFIIMLRGDISAAQTALASMSKGMGIALYTTASGVSCGLLLKLQLFNLNLCIEDSESEVKKFCDCVNKE